MMDKHKSETTEAKLDMNGKTCLVYGLGVTGISSIDAFQKLGATVLVFDESKKPDTDHALSALQSPPEFVPSVDEVPWDSLDFVLKSPGIALDRPLILAAQDHGVAVYSDLEIAYRLFGADRILAITGSNGKTTTSALLGHLLTTAGIPNIVVGNIGVGMLKAMVESDDDTNFVIECSSFQLASTEKFRPHVAAILNITPDHLYWHKTMDAYVEAKFAITVNQTEDDVLYLNRIDPYAQRAAALTKAQVKWISTDAAEGQHLLHDEDAWHLVGLHNVENALFASALAREAGANGAQIAEGLASFRAVEHRIEFVEKIDGVSFFDDSKATNVDSTVKALSAFAQPVILIAGGMDKKVPFDDFFVALKPKCKALILMGETKHQIAGWADEAGMADKVHIVEDMREAVAKAKALATNGDVVLLSPASASWDMYPSFEVRGDEFKSLVREK